MDKTTEGTSSSSVPYAPGKVYSLGNTKSVVCNAYGREREEGEGLVFWFTEGLQRMEAS